MPKHLSIYAGQAAGDHVVRAFAAAGIQMIVGKLKGASSTTVQSVLFDKKSWDASRAKDWLDQNDFKANKLDESTNKLRYRQRDPDDFEKDSLRTVTPGKQSAAVARDELVSVYQVTTAGVTLRIGRRYDYMSALMASASTPMDASGQPTGPMPAPEPEVEDDFSLQAVIFDRAKFSLVEAIGWLNESLDFQPLRMSWEEDASSFTFEVSDPTYFDATTLRLVDAKSYAEEAFAAEFAGTGDILPAFAAAKKHLPAQVPGLIHHASRSTPEMHTFGVKGEGSVRGYAHVFKDGGLKTRVTDGEKQHCFACKDGYKTLSQLTGHVRKFANKVKKTGDLKLAPSFGDNFMVTDSSTMPDMNLTTAADLEAEWREYEMLHSIAGIEIFRVGKWNGDEYTDADLDSMVDAFPEVGFQVPVKRGHDAASGDRAYGWVTAIRRVADKLVADFRDVPDSTYQVIKDRGFDAVSSEIFWNLKRGGKTFRRVLKAVALLGAETPGVSGLAPLREAVFGLPDTGFEALHSYTFEQEWTMDKIAKLTADLAEANTKIGDLTKQLSAAGTDATKIAKLAEDLTAATTAVTKLTTDLEAARKELPAADAIATLTAKVAAQDTKITSLTAANTALAERERKAAVEKAAAGCSIPSLRPLFGHLYNLASQDDATRVVTFKEGDKEVKKTAMDLLDDLTKAINEKAKSVFMTHSAGPSGERPEASLESEIADDPSAEADKRAREHMTKSGEKSYAKAVTHVLGADPELAQAYKRFNNSARH